MTWDVWLSYFTGLALFAPTLAPGTLVGTALVVNTCDAVMCRLFAHNHGRRTGLWTGLGFVFGLWAVVVLILLTRADPPDAAP